MKKIFLIMVILLPMIAFGQSKEADEYFEKGEELYYEGKYEEAIDYFKKGEILEKKELKPTSPNFNRCTLVITYCWLQLSINYYNLGNYQKAITLITEAIEFQSVILGENNPDIALYLDCLASYYSVLGKQNNKYGNFTEAISAETKALEIIKNISGENTTDYATSLHNLAVYHSHLGNYNEALRLITNALEIEMLIIDENDSLYASSLSTLGTIYAELGKYNESFAIEKKALRIRKNICGESSVDYSFSLGNLALYYSVFGNYTEAIRLEKKASEIRKTSLGVNNEYYAFSICNMAGYYSKLGNYTESIKLEKQALEIRKQTCGVNHPDYARSLSNLALYVHQIGNNTKAIELEQQALEIRRKTLGDTNNYYAISLSNLAGYYSETKRYDRAIELATEAMYIIKNKLGTQHKDYAFSLSTLAGLYSSIGKNNEAIKIMSQVLEIQKNLFDVNHPEYARTLKDMAFYNFKLGKYAEAINYGTQSIQIYKNTLGQEHPDYLLALKNVASFKFETREYEEATDLLKQTFLSSEKLVLKTFSYLTNKERSDFWDMYSAFFTYSLPYYVNKHQSSPLINLAYNGQLLSKGLLLNTELETQKLIEQSGNSEYIELFNMIRANRVILDKLYQQPISQRTMNVDSIESLIEKDQKFLMEHIKELGDYTRNLAIKWEDVQNKLSDKDIAIEFANFFDEDSKQEQYIALIVKKGMSSPELVKLFSEDQLPIINDYDFSYYTNSNLYKLVWKPLDKYLQGVQTIYFSPSGKLHTIAIEYLPNDSGEIFAKKFNVYRLSSSRELVIEHTVNNSKRAATYGGIIYDFDSRDWEKEKNNDYVDVFRDIAIVDGPIKCNYLPSTKTESEFVNSILTLAKYSVVAKSEKDATEHNFKMLSGKDLQILHIATHGFYEHEQKMKKTELRLFSLDEKSQEDRSLSCSGLLMAGANAALNPDAQGDIPEGIDDGILTAKEISHLDFKGLDLVVLSACQTGLGEVTSEGVFGLQRGFKKAGAHTIIMSLWDVYDMATQHLMTEFFQNLANGKSKREAFVLAQEKVRQKYPDPEEWAAFIMVDGVE